MARDRPVIDRALEAVDQTAVGVLAACPRPGDQGDLRQVRYSGRLSSGEFIVGRRTGDLDRPAEAASWDDAVRHSESQNAAGKAAVAELGRLADHSR